MSTKFMLDVYVERSQYDSPRELRGGIREYVGDYNALRPHQSHDYDTPEAVYRASFVA